MSNQETLLAEAILGKDAEEFLSSELGRYLIGRAEQEEQEALNELAIVSADNPSAVRELQAKAWRARSVKGWLAELVSAGRSAMAALEGGDPIIGD